MTDALLVSDQQISAEFLPEASSNKISFSPQSLSQHKLALPGPSSFSGNASFYGEQTLDGYGLVHHQRGRSIGSFASYPPNREATLDTLLWLAKAALETAAQITEAVRKTRQFQEELHWLTENRPRFLGKWIALQGEQLLAVGATAKEVFSKVADQKGPPLVIKITDDELPFAGW
jgi:hypothetical protein